MQNKVATYIRQQDLCRPGDRVLVAFSGGIDSTALLDILHKLSASLSLTLAVIHVDHCQFPGSASNQVHLRAKCRRLRLPFFGYRAQSGDLDDDADEASMRDFRYRLFDECATQNDCRLIATGHTESDQVETVLMRILRGTGTSGLAGIPTCRSQRFVRPLLCCSRSELESYLRSRRLRWQEDPTNNDPRHQRNLVRHQLLPYLRSHFNPAVDQALLRLSKSALRDNEFIESQAKTLLKQVKRLPAQVTLPRNQLDLLPDAVISRLLRLMLSDLTNSSASLELAQLDRILHHLHKRPPRPEWSLDLAGGIAAGASGNTFFLRYGHPQPALGFDLRIDQAGETILPDGAGRLRFSKKKIWSPRQASAHMVFFDAEQTGFPLGIRSAKPGDRLDLWGGAGSKKVARLLMDAKVPRGLRPRVPILVKAGKILWVAGLRRSNFAPITAKSRRILAVEFLGPGDVKERLNSGR